MNIKISNKSLISEQRLKFLQKCFEEIDGFDVVFYKILDQMDAKARERVIDAYYNDLKKIFTD